MKNILFFSVLICLLGCNTMRTGSGGGKKSSDGKIYDPTSVVVDKQLYINMYDDLLPDDEEKIHTDYTSLTSKRADGKYIVRNYYPDTKTLIAYNEFNDQALLIKNGPSKEFSDYGVVTKETQYSDGKKTGLEKNYHHKSGNLLSEGSYMNGKKHGPWKTLKDGNRYEDYEYDAGKKDGEYAIYNEEGDMAAMGIYRQDSIVETKILIKADYGKLKSAPGKEGKFPLFGQGCPELKEYDEKRKCSTEKMLIFIYKNLKYPAIARENNLEGTAIAQFVVDKEGRVTDIDVIKGLNEAIRVEVTRVISKMPFWTPGTQDGEPVDVKYTLPVKFKLQ